MSLFILTVFFALPGESAFPLSHFYGPARSSGETEDLRKYLTQFRREIGFRFAEKVFDPELAPDGKPSKWWTCFSKRNFSHTVFYQIEP